MNCVNPLLAVRLYKPLEGVQSIKILPKRVDLSIESAAHQYGRENILLLPCGHCSACLARRAKEWSVRCCLEALDHDQNSFITLTYENAPLLASDVKKDMQHFIKGLRNKGYQIRYYGCCERGDQFGRLHAHMILFGYFPKSVRPWAKSESGYLQYRSLELDEIWSKGIVVVAPFHPYNAQYVAGYVVKKLLTDDDSFHIQSTRPGIGSKYFMKNMEKIYDTDQLVLTFGSHRFSVPRYFDKLADKLGFDLSDIKEKRMEKSQLYVNQALRDSGLDQDRMLVQQEQILNRTVKRKERKF